MEALPDHQPPGEYAIRQLLSAALRAGVAGTPLTAHPNLRAGKNLSAMDKYMSQAATQAERFTLLLGELGRLREFLQSVGQANNADHSLGLYIRWVDKAMTSLEQERQRSKLWPKFVRSAMVLTPVDDLYRAFCRADGDGYFGGLEEQGEIMRRVNQITAIGKQCAEM